MSNLPSSPGVEEQMNKRCKKCLRPLPDQPATGRPKSYCGPACRRAAQSDIGRVNHLIDTLEDSLAHFRSGLATSFFYDIPTIENELERQRNRLHELLEPDEPDEKQRPTYPPTERV
jgi:hypothetical protein